MRNDLTGRLISSVINSDEGPHVKTQWHAKIGGGGGGGRCCREIYFSSAFLLLYRWQDYFTLVFCENPRGPLWALVPIIKHTNKRTFKISSTISLTIPDVYFGSKEHPGDKKGHIYFVTLVSVVVICQQPGSPLSEQWVGRGGAVCWTPTLNCIDLCAWCCLHVCDRR